MKLKSEPIKVICPCCKKEFTYQRGYKKIFCTQTCANIHHGKNKQIQINKVISMRNSSKNKGLTWPTATKEWSEFVRSKIKNNRPWVNWTTQQHELIDKNFNILVKEHIEQKITLKELSKKYGFSSEYLAIQFKKRNIDHQTYTWKNTMPERKIIKFLKEQGIDYQSNTRKIISPQELDIFIPSKNLAIEINELYWHREKNSLYDLGVLKSYHLNKLKQCQSKGINLLQFWDIEINNQFDIVKSIILNKLGLIENKIYARKCEIKEIDSNTAKDFLNSNHIQGYVAANIKLGLIYKNALVSLMTFSKNRTNSDQEWELVRFCSLINHSIVGAAQKLFNSFLQKYQVKSIVSYSDRRLFNGDLYLKLKFDHSHDTPPNYWYFKESEYWLHHRRGFQKHLLSKKLQNFDANLTEIQNMNNNDWFRVFDCGNSVWVLNL